MPRGRPKQVDARFRELARSLRARLLKGEWKGKPGFPSLRDLAEEYGVSLATVQKSVRILIDEKRLATSPYRRTVLGTHTKPGMDPHASLLIVHAATLDKVMRNPGQRNLHLGLSVAAGEMHVPLWVVHGYDLAGALPAAFFERPLKGVVLAGHFDSHVLKGYERLKLPVVRADKPADQVGLHSVGVANREATRGAVRKLVSLGHRHIALVRRVLFSLREIEPDSREREEGFRAGLRAAGIRFYKSQVFNFLPRDNEFSRTMHRLLAPETGATAVLAADAGIARSVMRAAERAHRSVPRDLSVVAFQDHKGSDGLSGPFVDMFEIGRRVVRMIEDNPAEIQGERVQAPWREGRTVAAPNPDNT